MRFDPRTSAAVVAVGLASCVASAILGLWVGLGVAIGFGVLVAMWLASRVACLEGAVRRSTGELEATQAKLEDASVRLGELVITDGLTGLSNHRHLQERLKLEVDRTARSGLPLSLVMIDVDHFKRYNDEHGHPAGDAALRQLGQVLSQGRRKTDVVARYGGEEFAVLLPDTQKDSALKVADQLRSFVQQQAPVTISLGVASCPEDASDSAGLLLAADAALLAAKRSGRNRVVPYEVRAA